MRVYLCSDYIEKIKTSGVGRALEHQQMALEAAGVPYTLTGKEPYDVLHINTVFLRSFLKAKKAKRAGKAIVYHAHSTEEDFKNSFIFSNALAKLFGWWITQCYSTGDLILTPSEYSKSLLENYGIAQPVAALSNGIDLSYWQSTSGEVAAFREKYHIQPTDKLVLSVGIPIKRKGILDFVKLAERLPEYQFIWFGYTDPKFLPKEVVQAMQMNLPNLQFPGYIERDELRVAYQACDLYVFLTLEETEGIVLLEALASKADTLVRDIPVFEPDYVHQKNIYKGRNIEEFVERTVGILEGRLPSLAEAGYVTVAEKSIEKIGDQLKAFYEEVLEETAPESFYKN